jgi:phosphatidylserine/phosphatidylglycerophosphate/cardiolipin synthase-like enzyme
MPWHDIALQMRGDSVVDLLRHFVQYWEFVKREYEFSISKMISQIRGRGSNVHAKTIAKQIKDSTK